MYTESPVHKAAAMSDTKMKRGRNKLWGSRHGKVRRWLSNNHSYKKPLYKGQEEQEEGASTLGLGIRTLLRHETEDEADAPERLCVFM